MLNYFLKKCHWEKNWKRWYKWKSYRAHSRSLALFTRLKFETNAEKKQQQQQLIYHYINNSHANQVVIRQEETIHIHVWFVCRQSSNLVFWTYTQIVGVVIEFLMMTMTMAMMLLLCFLHFINWDDSLGHKKNIYNCIIGDSTSHTHTTKTSTTRWEREKVKTEMENL